MIKKVLSFASVNIVLQIVNMISGVMLANWMTTRDYAGYTVYNFALGAIGTLTSGGVGLVFNGIIGRGHEDKSRINSAYTYAQEIRRKIGLIVMPLLFGYTGWLLIANEINILTIAIILLGLLVYWMGDYWSRLRQIILTQQGKFHTQQLADLIGGILRVVLFGGLHLIGSVVIILAIIINSLVSLIKLPVINTEIKKSWGLILEDACHNYLKDKEEILNFFKRQIVFDVFYCMQPQVLLTLLAIYGTSQDTAGLGALGRIAQILLPIQAVISAFAIPKFTKIKIISGYKLFKYSVPALFAGTVLCVLAYNFPDLFLSLLGENYNGLSKELMLVCIGSAMGLVLTTIWQLLANRGLNKYTWITIPLTIIWMLVSIEFMRPFDLAKTLILQIGMQVCILPAIILEIYGQKNRNQIIDVKS